MSRVWLLIPWKEKELAVVDAGGWRQFSNEFFLLRRPITSIGVYHHRKPMDIQPTNVLTLRALPEEEIHCIVKASKEEEIIYSLDVEFE